jgi:putative inorganic carbon (hco3(-)) transporter
MHFAAVLRAEPFLWAYVALVPTAFLAAYGRSDHDATRALQLLALLLAAGALWTACWRQKDREIGSRPALWALVIAALATASTAMSAMPAMALQEVALILGLIAVAVGAADEMVRHGLRGARIAVLIGSGVYAFVLFALIAASVAGGANVVWSAMAVGYDNYRFFNHVQTAALPLLALQVIGAPRGGRGQWVAWFTMVVFWAFIICSSARGTALAIAAGVVVASAMTGVRAVWPLARTLGTSLLVGLLVYGLVFQWLPRLGLLALGEPAERSVASISSDSARLQLWQVAVDQIRSSPWLGIGPMHYAHQPNPKAAHPHNIYLQIAAEWGIPMLLALLALAGVGLAKLRAAIKRADGQAARAEGAGLLVACIAILADGAVSGNFVMPVAQMWIALVAAWAIAWTRRQGDASTPPLPRSPGVSLPRWAWPSLVLASQVWLVAAVWDEIRDPAAHLKHVHRDLVQNAKSNPRFWSDGWF